MHGQQLAHLQSAADAGVYEETRKLVRVGLELKQEYRLPLLDIALASLRQLSPGQYELFRNNLNTLIEIDRKVSLFEWAVRKIVFHNLDPVFRKKPGTTPQNLTLSRARHACAVLLSVLVYSGKQQGVSNEEVFRQARGLLDVMDISLLPEKEINLAGLDASLDRLARLKPLEKPRVLKACARCIIADRQITANEVEMYRAVAAILDCPVPPLVLGT